MSKLLLFFHYDIRSQLHFLPYKLFCIRQEDLLEVLAYLQSLLELTCAYDMYIHAHHHDHHNHHHRHHNESVFNFNFSSYLQDLCYLV